MAERVTRQYIEVLGQGVANNRVTRQYVEVLGQGVSNVRVTRQYVEVLGAANIIEKVISDSLTFSEIAYQNIKRETISENLVFTERLPIWFNEHVTESFSFSDTPSPVHFGVAIDDLSFDEILVDTAIYHDFDPTSDSLLFLEIIDGFNSTQPSIVESLILAETIIVRGPISVNVFDYLNTTENIYLPIINVSIDDTLTLNDSGGLAIPITVIDTLTLQEGYSRLRYSASTTLTFSEIASAGKGFNFSESLTINSVVTCRGVFKRTVIDTLNIGYAVTYFLDAICLTKTYSPFIGESNIINQPIPPISAPPIIQGLPANTRFILSYPAIGIVTNSVMLRAPEMDNRDRLAFNRINRETRGGKLSVFADPIWPKVNTLILTFTGLDDLEINNFQQFTGDYLGKEIRLTDWFGRDWIGVITKPNNPASHNGKRDGSLDFEFEGVLVGGVVPGNTLNMGEIIVSVVIRRPQSSDNLVFYETAAYILN